MENPNFVFSPYADDEKKTPLFIRVPNASGAMIFEHNKPVLPAKLFAARLKNRTQKEMEYAMGEVEATVFWLTGGEQGDRSHETDIYGVVHLPMEDLSSTLLDMATLTESDSEADNKKAAQAYRDLQRAHIEKTKKSLKIAQEIAESRVRRALKDTHVNLLKQWETMHTQGMGKYSPSIAEAVGAHILAAELEKAADKKKEMIERFQKVAAQTSIML